MPLPTVTAHLKPLTILSISESEYEKYLSQVSFSTYDNRETINVGLVWRGTNSAITLIYGFNSFYDYEINSNHSRLEPPTL